MATFEEIKAQVTAEVESEKPLYGESTETGRYEYTDSDYQQVIIDRTNDKFNQQEYGWIEERLAGYGSWNEQLDKLWHDIDAGKLDKTGEWYKAIKKVKTDNPKPS